MSFARELEAKFGPGRVGIGVPLAPFTTFKVGGPADVLLETRSAEDIVDALQIAHRASIPVTILGGGSNVLIGDRGIRGLVIRPRGATIEFAGEGLVRADTGATVNGLVRWTINHGAGGLEAWAGTPGTVGGGIFGNAHFGSRLLGDLVESVRLADMSGVTRDVPAREMEFGYDRSRLQRTREVLLWAVFRVGRGDPATLRATARQSLAYRKRTQPLDTPSAGCIFQNPDPSRDAIPDGIPASAGALIDRAGLKGLAHGGARVSPTHANFIVNEGGATAADIAWLIARCRDGVRERFAVDLQEEIVRLGES